MAMFPAQLPMLFRSVAANDDTAELNLPDFTSLSRTTRVAFGATPPRVSISPRAFAGEEPPWVRKKAAFENRPASCCK